MSAGRENPLVNRSYLSGLLRSRGLYLSRRRGQNFLVDRNILAKIVGAGEPGPSDLVVEIGAGAGTLTRELAYRAGRVKAVEVDRGLAELLRETVAELPNVEVIEADFLRLDPLRLLSPESFGAAAGMGVKVIANPPYSIGGEILARLLLSSENLRLMVLTLPREVGIRVTSPPGSGDYGTLSVLAGMFSRPEVLFPVGRRCFFPVPRVDSVVIRFEIVPGGRYPVSDLSLWKSVVRAAFGRRRKFLKNSLASLSALGYTARMLTEACRRAGIDPSRRAETLSGQDFARLSDELAAISGRGSQR